MKARVQSKDAVASKDEKDLGIRGGVEPEASLGLDGDHAIKQGDDLGTSIDVRPSVEADAEKLDQIGP